MSLPVQDLIQHVDQVLRPGSTGNAFATGLITEEGDHIPGQIHHVRPLGDGDDRTPLNTAAKSGFVEYVTILLARGAHPNIADRQGRTPLSRAFDTRHWDIATQLVRGGAKLPDAPLNTPGETLLHKAAKAGHVELIQALLDAGADPHASTIAGKTAVDYAQRAKKDDVVTALTRTGP